MKFIKSKLLQKSKGNKAGRYLLTMEVTDYDLEMFEEFGQYTTAIVKHEVPEVNYKKMQKYLFNCFHKVFHKLWRLYDE